MVQSKDIMHGLESVIRRSRDAEIGIIVEGGKYLAYRKKMKKVIAKELENLKAIKNEFTISSRNKDMDTFSILTEAEVFIVNSLESLLLFITAPKGLLKQGK